MLWLAIFTLVFVCLVCVALYHNGYLKGQIDTAEVLLRLREHK